MRGQLARLWWVGSGRELLARNSGNPETETRKPAAVGNMLLVCRIEFTDTKPIRRK